MDKIALLLYCCIALLLYCFIALLLDAGKQQYSNKAILAIYLLIVFPKNKEFQR